MFSGEVFFALYVIAGAYKSIIPLQEKIDLTLLFMIISFAIAIKRLIKEPILNKGQIKVIFLYGIFYFILIFSLFYTPSEIYAKDKITKMFFLVGWNVLGTLILLKSDKSILRFLMTILIISLIMSINIFFEFLKTGTMDFIEIESTNYLSYSRLAATSMITILCYFFLKSKNYISSIFFFLLLLFMSFACLVSGARSTFVTLILCLLVVFIILIKLNYSVKKLKLNKKYFILITVLVVVLIYLFNLGYFDLIKMRLEAISTEGKDTPRYVLADAAKEMWMKKPIMGWGLGSYTIVTTGDDKVDYPHNIILELLSENGIIGLIPFLIICFLSVKNCLMALKKCNLDAFNMQLTVTILLIFWISMIAFSSLEAARLMHIFLVLGIMSPYRKMPASNEYILKSDKQLMKE